jgi:hypothetical protein
LILPFATSYIFSSIAETLFSPLIQPFPLIRCQLKKIFCMMTGRRLGWYEILSSSYNFLSSSPACIGQVILAMVLWAVQYCLSTSLLAILDEAAMQQAHAVWRHLHFNNTHTVTPTDKGVPCGAQPAHPAAIEELAVLVNVCFRPLCRTGYEPNSCVSDRTRQPSTGEAAWRLLHS